jgi:hypothetical protein
MGPTTDDLALKRAAEIHAEKRTTFDFGPAPFAWIVDVAHPKTGRKWFLRVSRFTTKEAVDALVESIGILIQTGEPEAVAMGLAYIAAATEITGMESARGVSE